MIKYFLSIFILLAVLQTQSYASNYQELKGAWQHIEHTSEGDIQHIILFSGNYFSWTVFQVKDGAFLSTKGGSWAIEENGLKVTYEFNTASNDRVGNEDYWRLTLRGEVMVLGISDSELREWKAIDQGVETPLMGAWLFSGRKKDGEITRRDNSTSPRKTMKLLTGSRFQWIAYNTETNEFFGTGGGTYNHTNGVYTEHIGFFSRDDKRVGAQLEFNANVEGNDWHHQGKSSTGEDMYEIWSKRN